ncbi:MAG: hypothetical protein PHH54_02805 [Candidatus Nanoarchaeia archaeon]|nr:hypothetical protein [Candidatus Nanoarchaeia archaeon]MDD5740890.1 hypothetical protein [Candidatus Nanoarchaeia archaeon]
MKKRAEIKSREILIIGIVSLVLCLTFVWAAGYTARATVGTNSFNFNEDSADSVYNITINISGAAAGDVTQINITLPSTFKFFAGSNGTSALNGTSSGNVTFRNSSLTLIWENRTIAGVSSVIGLANISNNNSFWFNATAPTPGLYDIRVNIALTNGTNVGEQNISVTINDTTPPDVTVSYPVNNSGYNSSSINFNLTIADNNVSSIGYCWFNLTGSNVNYSMSSNGSTTAYNATNSSIADGNYTARFWCNDSSNNINNSVNKQVNFIIDNVAPTTIAFGTNTEVDLANLSQSNIYINVTNAVELNEDNITFNIYYSNGSIANSTARTNKARLINVTGLTDGNYTYNVTVYDKGGSSNSTATRTIRLDTHAPNVTFSCTPTTLTKSGTVTCDCVATDTNSGLLSAPSFTINPLVEYGTQTTTCTVGDFAGNNITESISYTVSGGAPASSGGGGGGSSSKTYVPSAGQISAGYTQQLKSNERVKLTIASQTHYVTVSSLTTTNAKISVSSTPQTATLNIGETKKFDVTGDGYYDLNVKLNGIDASKADITVKSIYEISAEPSASSSETAPEETTGTIGEGELPAEKNLTLWIVVIIIIVVLIVGIVWYYKSKNN